MSPGEGTAKGNLEVDAKLYGEVMDAVERQMRDAGRPEVRRAYGRLIAAGYAPTRARRAIALVLSLEIVESLKTGRPFDEGSYAEALRRLPQVPSAQE